THYDPQITFDPYATVSCFHGVTTVVAGNCGFSVAPCRAPDRSFLGGIFARVENMDPIALSAIEWNDFETFPQFLDSRRGKLGVNLGCYVGHSNLRRWVMGPDASEREATDAEVDAMCRLVEEAMAAGAAGLSPTATWNAAKAFLDRATDAGAPVFSMLIARPFDRPVTIDETNLHYLAVPAWDRMLKLSHTERVALLGDPTARAELREAVEHYNR